MKLKMILVLCLAARLAYSQDIINQQESQSLRKNSVYATLGLFPIYVFTGVSAEHLFTLLPDKKISAIVSRIGAGPWAFWEDRGMNYFLNLGLLFGKNKHHLEIGAGPMIMHDSYDGYNSLLPSGNIGYRLQKPGRNFVLRAGGGWPEGAYLSVGIAF